MNVLPPCGDVGLEVCNAIDDRHKAGFLVVRFVVIAREAKQSSLNPPRTPRWIASSLRSSQ
jgi:hypothetical protein